MIDVLPRALPQTDTEWREIADFTTEYVPIEDEKMQFSHLAPVRPSNKLVVMLGGVPRDPERQKRMPLVNKLYGSIALLASTHSVHAIMYQQIGTGGSSGNLSDYSIEHRINHLTELVKYLQKELDVNDVSLVGMSLGSYIAARGTKAIESNGARVSSLVMQSPAAYPREAENIPYGSSFTAAISGPWDVDSSPVFDDVQRFAREGGRVVMSYFQSDAPPIPRNIQNTYHKVLSAASDEGLDITQYSINGVAHNFRKLQSDPNGTIIDNRSVRATALQVASLIL